MGKKKKELGLDSMGIQKTMRLTDYLGDGIGQLPLNIMSSLVGQLTYFYTEKVGLAVRFTWEKQLIQMNQKFAQEKQSDRNLIKRC